MLGVRRRRSRRMKRTVFGDYFCHAGFDVFGDFGKSGAGVRGRIFQAVILRGIVAGGEVDGAVEFAAHDFKGDRGSGRKRFAEQRADAVVLKDVNRELGKFFGIEACVVADENRGLLRLGFHVFRDGRDREPHVREGEIVGDEAAPAGRAELDGRGGHVAVF